MIQVVLVDGQDHISGIKEKVEAHLGEGALHRAFTILVFNEKGETLVARRSSDKMLWPLFWDNACASHPSPGEDYVAAGERRLLEELGFTCKLKVIDRFQYQIKFQDIGSENELCTTLVGEYSGQVNPVKTEVSEYKWMKLDDLKIDMADNPDVYTEWFKIALSRFIEKDRIK